MTHERTGNGSADPKERRGWHIGKDIPVALLLTMTGLFAAAVMGYTNVQNAIERLTESSVNTSKRLDALTLIVHEGNVPFAVNAARISVLEANVAEIKLRIAELEHRK